jgi:proteasome component ECM29
VLDNLYSGLQGVFSKIGDQLSKKEDQAPDRISALQQALQLLADGLLFRDFNPSIESLRMKRARAAETFIKAVSQGPPAGVGVLSDSQQQQIESWLGQERAEPIRQILKSALRNL